MQNSCSRSPTRLIAALLCILMPLPLAAQQDEKFAIQRFEVSGSKIFSAADFDAATRAYTGTGKVFGDIQKALDAVEGMFKTAGYSAVQVIVPEQELNRGVVRFDVIETPLGTVTVAGNVAYSTENIRRSLPGLREGQTPNAREISESVQLANENQGKQVEVILGVGKKDGTVDARVDVKEDGLQRWYVNVDNTGTRATGRLRAGVVYQHNNLFDRDQTLTAGYTLAPDQPSNAKLDVVSLGYRIPFYAIGDSLDLVYAYSNVNTPNPAVGIGAEIIGKGQVAGLRWNHYFPRSGEYSSRVVFGFDWKDLENCPTGPASCTKQLTAPASVTYVGKLDRAGDNLNYSLGLSRNTLIGSKGVRPDGPSQLNGITRDDFTVVKGSASYSRVVSDEWLLRIAATAQHSLGNALVPAEQFGLAGSTAVRGFLERAVATDTGVFGNLELYTPELAPSLGLSRGNLRALAFFDHGIGRNHVSPRGLTGVPAGANLTSRLSSWGVGFRYSVDKDLSVKLDVAQILEISPQGVHTLGGLDDNSRGDSRAHLSITFGF